MAVGMDIKSASLFERDMHVLQNVIAPPSGNSDRAPLYIRGDNLYGQQAHNAPKICLRQGDKVDLATFFNSFSLKWFQLTKLDDLYFVIKGTGRVRVIVSEVYKTALQIVLRDDIVDLVNEPHSIQLPLSAHGGDLFGVYLEAISDIACLENGVWCTSTPPKRDVCLAAIITTFKREAAAKQAMLRFRSIMQDTPDLSIHLFVIDNGKTLDPTSDEFVTILPNKNLGGSGGFTRGLLAATDANRFTHCLFMDDDAACEEESVRRTIALLKHIEDDRSAIAGAMFLLNAPLRQYEKGAMLKLAPDKGHIYEGLHANWDLADVGGVACNDPPDVSNYGGWWYFAFSIKAARSLPFPFFVRGDDVDFCIRNSLPIVTLNGIATWCESFSEKISAPTVYLACRAWLALALMHGNEATAKFCARLMLRDCLHAGLRFDYAAMEAGLAGLFCALAGPSSFGAAPSPLQEMQKFRVTNSVEIDAIDVPKYHWVEQKGGIGRRLVRNAIDRLTLGGHFLPAAFTRKSLYIHVRHPWLLPRAGLLLATRFAHGKGDNAVCLARDNRRFRQLFFQWVKMYILSWVSLGLVKKRYNDAAVGQFSSRSYWMSVLELDK